MHVTYARCFYFTFCEITSGAWIISTLLADWPRAPFIRAIFAYLLAICQSFFRFATSYSVYAHHWHCKILQLCIIACVCFRIVGAFGCHQQQHLCSNTLLLVGINRYSWHVPPLLPVCFHSHDTWKRLSHLREAQWASLSLKRYKKSETGSPTRRSISCGCLTTLSPTSIEGPKTRQSGGLTQPWRSTRSCSKLPQKKLTECFSTRTLSRWPPHHLPRHPTQLRLSGSLIGIGSICRHILLACAFWVGNKSTKEILHHKFSASL